MPFSFYTHLARPLIFTLDPERAHRASLYALRYLPLASPPPEATDPCLSLTAFGLDFPNPLGIAAGYDKDAEVLDGLWRLGFGFVETGTITPRPQGGNPRPRVFRLEEDHALINRMGFNSQGQDMVYPRLKAHWGRGGIVGVNIGANKDQTDRISDYLAGLERFYDVASYFTINISSPNTPGLRDLQQTDQLDPLLACVCDTRAILQQRTGLLRPILLKIAPDMGEDALAACIHTARKHAIDGMILANTTVSRPPTLRNSQANEKGGLSGQPLFSLSTQMLAKAFLMVEGQFPLIGVGGIHSPETAQMKIEAGAHLLQIYTGLVYEGPCLIRRILKGLVQRVKQSGAHHITPIIGSRAAEFAAKAPELERSGMKHG